MEITLSDNIMAVIKKISSNQSKTAEQVVTEFVSQKMEDLLLTEFVQHVGTSTVYNPETGEKKQVCLTEMVAEMNREGSSFFPGPVSIKFGA